LRKFPLKVIVIVALAALPGLSAAYNDGYKSVLKTIFNAHAKEAYISTFIDNRIFDCPRLKKSEPLEDQIKRLFEKDEIDKSLSIGGRVSSNLSTLLSDKLLKNFSIKTVDYKIASYGVYVRVAINQLSGACDSNKYFNVSLTISFQEAATTLSGNTGFIDIDHFSELVPVIESKEGIETQVYVALDKAFNDMQKTFSKAREYCASAPCK